MLNLCHGTRQRLQGIEAKPRLKLRPRDRDFFAETVQRLDFDSLAAKSESTLENESQKHIKNNSALLLNRLKNNFTTQEQLLGFGIFLMTRCFLVVVSTPSQQSAFRVFSVLNNRGLDLLPSDIIKAEAIGKITESKRDSFNDRWEEIEVDTGRNGLNDLLGFIRMIYAKSKAKRSLLEEFKEHVLSRSLSAESLIDKVIEPYAQAYIKAKFSCYESSHNAEEINALFGWLNRIDNADWLPVALSYLKKYGDDHDAVLTFVRDLEGLAAQMHITAANINQRIERYSEVLNDIEHSETSLIESVKLKPSEKLDFNSVISGDIYFLTAKRRNYLLLRLDSFLSDGAASYNYNVLTIEHVLPQTVATDSEWEQWWPDPVVRAAWVHKLGNLVPLTRTRNSMASNYGFTKKKVSYFTGRSGVTSYVLTSQVLAEPHWMPATVEKRQQSLLQVCQQNWNLN